MKEDVEKAIFAASVRGYANYEGKRYKIVRFPTPHGMERQALNVTTWEDVAFLVAFKLLPLSSGIEEFPEKEEAIYKVIYKKNHLSNGNPWGVRRAVSLAEYEKRSGKLIDPYDLGVTPQELRTFIYRYQW